jgi:DNA-binding winged helix-turn-helix (wHTH) protein
LRHGGFREAIGFATLGNVPADTPSTKHSAVFRFGVYEADLQARELRKQGRQLRLQDQPFAILAMLLERAGTVVTREELRERLWPSDTFVDFDHSLNTAVNKLREVLGDSATRPRFIETLARRGYRFVAEVQADAEPTSGNVPASVPSAPASEHDLPKAHRGLTRSLLALIQIMYLIFYVEALIHWEGVYRVAWPEAGVPIVFIAVLVTAAVGIPLRFYLLSATGFDYSRLGEKFNRMFPGILLLDQLWAVAPFLILNRIGFGIALGATAALLYVPFAERTLVRMAYPKTR